MSQSTIRHTPAPSIPTPLQFILIAVQEQLNVEMTRNDVEMNDFYIYSNGNKNDVQIIICKGGTFDLGYCKTQYPKWQKRI